MPPVCEIIDAKFKNILYNLLYCYNLSLAGILVGYMVVVFDCGLIKIEIENLMEYELYQNISFGLFCAGGIIGILISMKLISKFGRRIISIANEIILI